MTDPKTGWVEDPIFLKHQKSGHPERPERFRAVVETLVRTGVQDALTPIPARPATESELRLVHDTEYIRLVKETCEQGGGQLDPDTYVNRHSHEAAIRAVGGLIDLTDAVWQGKLCNGYAFVRPPGHHALPDRVMGFCLFNQAAIAVRRLLQHRGADRIAIVDCDVHHGNGTQAVFVSDPSVLYVSTHQFPHFPGTGWWEETGTESNILNIPLSAGMGNEAVLEYYTCLVVPKLVAFQPQMIIVSAGYDTHWRDPLAGLQLSLTGQAALSDLLSEAASALCGGKIVFTLEGGYDPQVLLHGVLNTLYTLLGREARSDPIGPAPDSLPADPRLIHSLRRLHRLDGFPEEKAHAL